MELISLIFQSKILSDHIPLACIRWSLPKIKPSSKTYLILSKIIVEKSKLQERKRKMAGANSHAALMYLQILSFKILFSLPLARLETMEQLTSLFLKVSVEKQVKVMGLIGPQFLQTLILWLILKTTDKFSLRFSFITVMAAINWQDPPQPHTKALLKLAMECWN